jgi:hypothetical protein
VGAAAAATGMASAGVLNPPRTLLLPCASCSDVLQLLMDMRLGSKPRNKSTNPRIIAACGDQSALMLFMLFCKTEAMTTSCSRHACRVKAAAADVCMSRGPAAARPLAPSG